MIRKEQKTQSTSIVLTESWFHGGNLDEDLLGIHDCVQNRAPKPVQKHHRIDFLRGKDGVPLVGPDGQPWFIEVTD